LEDEMNANELADALDKAAEYLVMIGDADFRQAATMLRQQQAKLEKSQELLREYTTLNMRQHAEIESLRSELDRAVELYTDKAIENEALKKELYFKDYYEELPDTPVDLLRKAQEK
jgi:hypothetical protein